MIYWVAINICIFMQCSGIIIVVSPKICSEKASALQIIIPDSQIIESNVGINCSPV